MKPELIKKHCKCCGKVHSTVPAAARKWVDEGILIGWMWECECGSTLLHLAMTLQEAKKVVGA